MPLRDVLAFVEIPAEPAPDPDMTTTPALEQAVELAKANGAYLRVIVSAARLVAPSTPLYASFASSLTAQANERAKACADHIAAAAEKAVAAAGIKAHVSADLQSLEAASAEAVRMARTYDVIVVDQPKTALDARGSLFQTVLFEGGRPVIVATPARKVGVPKSVVCAWDGSSHATRAIASALALFPLEQADLVSVTGEKALAAQHGAAEMEQHIARHGIAAKSLSVPLSGKTVSTTLQAYAASSGADLIVMGGYGHSRWREMLLGGVTRDLTQGSEFPLLLAY